MVTIRPLAPALLLAMSFAAAGAPAQTTNPQGLFDRSVRDFLAGKVAESVVGFDALARMDPARAPQLWQRGIALYYAGR